VIHTYGIVEGVKAVVREFRTWRGNLEYTS